jgi:hypothetical protein
MPSRRRTALAATVALLAATLLAPPPAGAAPPDPPETPATLAARAADALVAGRPPWLRASPDDGFTQHPVISYLGRLEYVPYDRSYRGVPVMGGDFVVVTDVTGTVLTQSSALPTAITLASVTPVRTSDDARSFALSQVPGITGPVVEAPELIVYARRGPVRLAWRTTVAGRVSNLPVRKTVIMDAEAGTKIETIDHMVHGTGRSSWNGTIPLNTTPTAGGFTLEDPAVRGLSCRLGDTPFVSPDDDFGIAGNHIDPETACVDALFAAQAENRMLSSWLSRAGFDGTGGGWSIRLEPSLPDDAFDGTQVIAGRRTTWLTPLDLIGHEFGHGIDASTPTPRVGISGNGTQEFIADVFGTATEFFAHVAPDPPDYTIGERLGSPIRDLADPAARGGLNCYQPGIENATPHAAAGPGDRWFAVLTTGQLTVSPCVAASPLGSLPVPVALQVLHGAMLMKNSAASYPTYRAWTLLLAKYLFPTDCSAYSLVRTAWTIVGVPAQPGETCVPATAVTVTGPGARTSVSGVPTSLQLSATGGAQPYTWSATGLPPGLSIDPATGLISGTPTTAGAFTVTATATGAPPLPQRGSTTFAWTINDCTGQIVGNPGFEDGPIGWTATPGVIIPQQDQPPANGLWDAWLDGYGMPHTDTLRPAAGIPAGCQATLSFALHIDTAETTTATAFDRLTVTHNGTVLATYSNLNKGIGYLRRTVNVSAPAAVAAPIVFTGIEDSTQQTSFVLDDVTLTLSRPSGPAPAVAAAPPAVAAPALEVTGGVSDQSTVTRIGDRTGDGRADLTGVSPSGDVRTWASTGNLTGDFRLYGPPVLVDTGWLPAVVERVLTADVDGDGLDDFGAVYVNGDVRFWPATGDLSGDFRPRGPGVLVETGWTTAAVPRIVVADADGDHRDDLGTVLSSGELRFWHSTGDLTGDFRLLPQSVNAGNGWVPTTVARVIIADVNGDGRDDLGANYVNGDLRIWLASGVWEDARLFGPATALAQTAWTVANVPRLLIADINGDHRDDLGAVLSDGAITVSLSTGDVTRDFAPYGAPIRVDNTTWLNGNAASRIIIGDVDGDGRDDIGAVSATGDITIGRASPSSPSWTSTTAWVKTRWTTGNVRTTS